MVVPLEVVVLLLRVVGMEVVHDVVVEDPDVIVEEVGGINVVEVSEVLDEGSEMVVDDVHGAEVVELCDVAEDEEIEETVVSHEVVVADASVVLHVFE